MKAAKIRYFSKPLSFFWNKMYKIQKQITPMFSDELIIQLLKMQNIKAAKLGIDSSNNLDMFLQTIELGHKDIKGELLHLYFLEKDLKDFLASTKLSDREGLRKYLFENGDHRWLNYALTNDNLKCVTYSFCIHLPDTDEGYAFLLTLFENGNIELYSMNGDQQSMMSTLFYDEWNKKTDAISMLQCELFRLALNTLAYINCFPECIKDGAPKIAYDDYNADKKVNKSIGVAKDIRSSMSQPKAVMPHFRKGYFRYLKSDYFTHKKGQIIFVAETMVKGRAKTVESAKNLENFK